MLALVNVGVEIAGRWLFRGANWNLQPGVRYGLVGRNGTGKSTLLRLMVNQRSPSEGRINRKTGLKIGFLNQDLLEISTEDPVIEVAMGAFEELRALEAELNTHLAIPPEKQDDAWLTKYGELQEQFATGGGYEMEARAHEVLSGLGFADERRAAPYASFSGGWRMRVQLAVLLLQEPDLLLLDEPTNHLDLPAIAWVEQYLTKFRGAVVTVSHDREFLDRMADETVEVRQQRLHFYAGNYSRFELEKAERLVQQKAAYENQQKLLADTEQFIERFRYKASKATQVQSRVKQLEKLERILPPEDDAPTVNFRFTSGATPGRQVLQISGLTKAYGDLVVLENAEAHLFRGDKVGLVGPNGVGKSTLLRILGGEEPFEGGRELGLRVELSTFGQHQLESLHPQNTIMDELAPLAYERGEQFVRDVMGGFLFGADELDKQVGVLSGGERARVALARALLSQANLLLLDEPTNHLDIASIDVLVQALNDYGGSYVIVSHNRDFLRRVTNKVWYIENRALKEYPGSYREFEQRPSTDAPGTGSQNGTAKMQAEPAVKVEKTTRGGDGKKLQRQRKAVQNRISGLERDIEALEAKEEEFRAKLADPELSADYEALGKLQQKIDRTRAELEAKLAEWEAASEELAVLDA